MIKPLRLSFSQPRDLRCGFTLLQIAITLAIIGLGMATIWQGGEIAWRQFQVYSAEKQLITLVQNMRGATVNQGQAQGNYTGTASSDLIQQLATMDVFPGDMKSSLSATVLNSPWMAAFSTDLAASPVGVAASDGVTVGAAGRYFRIRYQYTPEAICTQFVTRFARVQDEIKLRAIYINTVALPAAPTVDQAATECRKGAPNNIIEMEFNLRG